LFPLFATGINNTGGNFVVDTGGKFATRVNDTGSKFSTGINNAGVTPVSMTPALPQFQ
jgi:hypothetical protein